MQVHLLASAAADAVLLGQPLPAQECGALLALWPRLLRLTATPPGAAHCSGAPSSPIAAAAHVLLAERPGCPPAAPVTLALPEPQQQDPREPCATACRFELAAPPADADAAVELQVRARGDARARRAARARRVRPASCMHVAGSRLHATRSALEPPSTLAPCSQVFARQLNRAIEHSSKEALEEALSALRTRLPCASAVSAVRSSIESGLSADDTLQLTSGLRTRLLQRSASAMPPAAALSSDGSLGSACTTPLRVSHSLSLPPAQ